MSDALFDQEPEREIAPPTAEHLDVLHDVDGVLYPLPELFTPYAAEQLGRRLTLDTTNWEFYTEWGLGYDDFVNLLGQGVRERQLWWTGAPIADVVDAVRRIKAHEHSIHVVTARDVRGIEAEAFDADPALAGAPRVGGRHDQPRPGQDAGARPSRARSSLVCAVDDGPQVHRPLVQRRRGVRHRARPLGQLPGSLPSAPDHGGRRLDRHVDAGPLTAGRGRRSPLEAVALVAAA